MRTRGQLFGWARFLLAAALVASFGAPHAADPASKPEKGVPGTEAVRIEETVFNGRMTVYEAGRGKPRAILLVHGIGQEGARDFRGQIDWLKESFHVIAVDLPGFGQSDKANALYSPANYARVLKQVADRFFGRPFVLVGHSMGAVVSLRYAAAYPKDVERLVVIDAPGVLHRYTLTSRYLAQLGVEYVPPVVDSLDKLTGLARRLLAPLERMTPDPQIVLSSAQLRQRMLGADPAKIAGLAVVSDDLRAELPKIRAETLIVWGAQDTVAPLRTGRVLAMKLPNARLTVIERAAHEPMLETPERFRAVLEAFLERGLPPPPKSAAAPLEQHGEASCKRERRRVFEGDYDKLTLDGCQQIQIRNARVRELRVLGSSVTIDDSHIGGGQTGLVALGSAIVMTGGRIEGEVAIRASGSRLDLAAVDVEGSEAALKAPKNSYVVFSLCRVRSPHTRGELHDFYTVTEKKPL